MLCIRKIYLKLTICRWTSLSQFWTAGDAPTPSPRQQRPCYDIICGDIVTVHRPQRITSALS